jgi:hypothetical protein
MHTISEKIDRPRRYLLSRAAATAAVAQLGVLASANAQAAKRRFPQSIRGPAKSRSTPGS